MPLRSLVPVLLMASMCSILLAQDAAPPPTAPRVRVSESVMQAMIVKRVPPTYPPLARAARIQGLVVLNAIISSSGDVESVQLISGHPMLAPAAIEAVKQWHYQPYLLNGNPVEVETPIKVTFTLSGDEKMDIPTAPQSVGIISGGSESVPPNMHGVPVSEISMRALRLQRVDPEYPEAAQQARIQGSVILAVQVGKSGSVENITLISGHPMLAPSAIEAVKQWTYTPYKVNDEPVDVATRVSLNYITSADDPSKFEVLDAEPVATPSTTPKIATPMRVRVSSGVSQGLLISKVNPGYPVEARQQGIQGVVVLKAVIDREGNVVDLQLISGDPILAAAAIEAVKQWKYKPFLLNGTPLIVETQIQVNFTLQR